MIATQDRFKLIDALGILVIAIASIIGINQYTYGLYNHFITIPFLKDILHPELYPNDFLIAERKYFYTYFLSCLAWVIKTTGLSLAVSFFILYCLSLYFTLIAIFKIAVTLFNSRIVAYFSLLLLVFSFTTLGEVRTIESLFLERTLTLPILLFSIHAFLKKRHIVSYVLLGISFLFHPLSTIYVTGFIVLSSLLYFKDIGIKKLLISWMLLAVLMAPAIYLKIITPAPSLGMFNANPQWIELLRLRSTHHLFPFSWHVMLFIQAVLFLAGFFLTWKHSPARKHHQLVLILTGYILALCLAGTLFTELSPMAIIVQFQLFRSFKFLIYIAMIYYANYFVMESEHKENWLKNILVFILMIPIFYNGNIPKMASFLIIALTIFPLYALIRRNITDLKKYFLPAQLTLLLLLGIAGNIMRGSFTIENAQQTSWINIQQWAQQNTATNDLFIVAPNWEGFRVDAERTIYGDWKDGTQMFFNPEFGNEWFRRMKMLGYVDDNRLEETYEELSENDFKMIEEESEAKHPRTFVIRRLEWAPLSFPQQYSNEKYVVYEVR